MSLRTKYRPGFATKLVGSGDLANPVHEIGHNPEEIMNTGTASQEADLVFDDVRTLAISTSEELDLSGVLQDAFGVTIAFAKIKAIYVRADASNGGNIVVGGAASNAFVGPFADTTDKITLPAGAYIELVNPADGWTITAGTADLLKVENDDSGASASYTIQVVGTSA